MPTTNTHRCDVTADEARDDTVERLRKLDSLLCQALLALGSAGQTDHACRLAAAAWSLLRPEMPREAERYTGLLHRLTAMTHTQRKDVP